MNSLQGEDLWFSPDRKEYVWATRKGVNSAPKFDRLWKIGQADDVVRHIGSLYNLRVSRIRAENVQTQLGSDNTLKVRSGQKAIQWAFVNNGIIPKLGREVWGNMNFIIHRKLSKMDKETGERKESPNRAKRMPQPVYPLRGFRIETIQYFISGTVYICTSPVVSLPPWIP